MTIEEYKEEREKIKKKCNKDLSVLSKNYAFDNSPYQKGDIISDYKGTIMIESVKWCNAFYDNIPSCVYSGVRLTKNGKKFKSGETMKIYQVNMII